jgi:heat shock protein HslJ
MNKNITFPVLLMILALFLVACGALGSGAELEGTSWNLVEIAGQPVVTGSNPSLGFEQGQAGGNGSCNSFGGSYEAGNGKLTFGPLMSTLMYCEDVMEQETAYLAALQEAAGYEIKDGILLILDANGQVVLIFEP